MFKNILHEAKQTTKKWTDLAKVNYDLQVVERSIKELAHLAYDYRFSALPGAQEHYEDCKKALAVLRLKKGLLELEKKMIVG